MTGGTGKVYTFNWNLSLLGPTAGAPNLTVFTFLPVSYVRILQVMFTPYITTAAGGAQSITHGTITLSTPTGGEFISPLDALSVSAPPSLTAYGGNTATWKFGITNDGYETDFVLTPNQLVTVSLRSMVTVAAGDTLFMPVGFLFQRSSEQNGFENYK